MKRIDCFIPFVNAEQAGQTIANLKAEGLVNNIFLLAGENAEAAIEGTTRSSLPPLPSSALSS